jgi:hypothetical protein
LLQNDNVLETTKHKSSFENLNPEPVEVLLSDDNHVPCIHAGGFMEVLLELPVLSSDEQEIKVITISNKIAFFIQF